MDATPSQVRSALALASRKDDPNAHRVAELRQELKTAVMAEFIKKNLAKAPPLSDDQRRRLAALLMPVGAR